MNSHKDVYAKAKYNMSTDIKNLFCPKQKAVSAAKNKKTLNILFKTKMNKVS